MLSMRYNYSSIHIIPPNKLSQEIVNWGKNNIPDADIYTRKKSPNYGREDEIHITALYGIYTDEIKEINSLFDNYKKFDVKLGEIKIFVNQPKFDVVVIDIISNGLVKLNKFLAKKVKYINQYGEFKPHLTIAYIKKNKNHNQYQSSIWENINFTCDHIIFSSKSGIKHTINF